MHSPLFSLSLHASSSFFSGLPFPLHSLCSLPSLSYVSFPISFTHYSPTHPLFLSPVPPYLLRLFIFSHLSLPHSSSPLHSYSKWPRPISSDGLYSAKTRFHLPKPSTFLCYLPACYAWPWVCQSTAMYLGCLVSVSCLCQGSHC